MRKAKGKLYPLLKFEIVFSAVVFLTKPTMVDELRFGI